jgi:hypothetical protein
MSFTYVENACIFSDSWAKPRLFSITKVKTHRNVLHFDYKFSYSKLKLHTAKSWNGMSQPAFIGLIAYKSMGYSLYSSVGMTFVMIWGVRKKKTNLSSWRHFFLRKRTGQKIWKRYNDTWRIFVTCYLWSKLWFFIRPFILIWNAYYDQVLCTCVNASLFQWYLLRSIISSFFNENF